MVSRRRTNPKDEPVPSPRRRPATTLETRENQMISLAVDLAERQLREGTASAQVVTHYLKLGTTRERLEQARLEREVELLRAKSDQMASAERIEKLYTDAIAAMRSYQGQAPEELDDDPDL